MPRFSAPSLALRRKRASRPRSRLSANSCAAGNIPKSFTYDDVIALAQGAKGSDPFGYRAEFINLVRLAKTAQPLAPLPQ